MRHPISWIILLVVLVGAGIGGSALWNYLDSYEDTDDAQIDGDIYAITSRIAGTVKAVYVEDNQQVKAGQLLVELDPRDYDVSVEQAKAALDESRTPGRGRARPTCPLRPSRPETTVSTQRVRYRGRPGPVADAQRDYESAVADDPPGRGRQREGPVRPGPL